jgi:heme exporter protein A
VIAVKKLVKRFGHKTVLRGLEFRAEAGEFIALLGPNGAGKTTFLRVLASLSSPTIGEVRISGFLLPGQSAEVRRRLGVVLHEPLLYGDLTAEENLTFYGRMYGLADLPERIAATLELVGLRGRSRDLVRTFSRGMQQRLSIGRAVLHDPDVILFDEPYTGLDQDAGNMLDFVLAAISSQGKTIVMTSHDLARASALASRFDVISRGVISASGLRADLGPERLLPFYQEAVRAG